MTSREVDFWYWLVRHLPKKLIYFCSMHLIAYATTGKYCRTIVPDLRAMEAINRYSKDNNI